MVIHNLFVSLYGLSLKKIVIVIILVTILKSTLSLGVGGDIIHEINFIIRL